MFGFFGGVEPKDPNADMKTGLLVLAVVMLLLWLCKYAKNRANREIVPGDCGCGGHNDGDCSCGDVAEGEGLSTRQLAASLKKGGVEGFQERMDGGLTSSDKEAMTRHSVDAKLQSILSEGLSATRGDDSGDSKDHHVENALSRIAHPTTSNSAVDNFRPERQAPKVALADAMQMDHSQYMQAISLDPSVANNHSRFVNDVHKITSVASNMPVREFDMEINPSVGGRRAVFVPVGAQARVVPSEEAGAGSVLVGGTRKYGFFG
jgi:hypothetical protein